MTKRIEKIQHLRKEKVKVIEIHDQKNLNAMNKINKNSILIFDLDGTLIDTDKANLLSYREAIKKVKNLDLLWHDKERFTRENLYSLIPNLKDKEFVKIIEIKTNVFHKYLQYTNLNTSIFEIMKFFSRTNQIILATNSHKVKANLLLRHYDLFNLFDKRYYREDYTYIKNNKYKYIINNLNVAPHNVVIFEDDNYEIEKAILLKIPSNNIMYPTTKGEKNYA